MLDYAALEALIAVVREGSFESAAKRLNVTSSAISQRIKQLEERVGQVLIRRGSPCVATQAGHRLCLHVEQVALLEHQLRHANPELLPDGQPQLPTLKLAVNRDSLPTWFMDAVKAFSKTSDALLDVRIDDEECTAKFLKQGEVLAAVTANTSHIAGCNRIPLGIMDYTAAASPTFIARYFQDGVNPETMSRAPQMTFDAIDSVQTDWLRQESLLLPRHHAPKHFLPSPEGFVTSCEIGMGWGMHPVLMIAPQLRKGTLVELKPGNILAVPFYWFYTRSAEASLKPLTQCIVNAARTKLRPMPKSS